MNPAQHSSLTNASENMHPPAPRKFSLNIISPTNNISNNNNNNNCTISTKEHLDMNYILMQQQLNFNHSQTIHSPLHQHNFALNQPDSPQLIHNNNNSLIFPMSPPPQLHVSASSFYALPQPYYYLSNAVTSSSFHTPAYHDTSNKQTRSNSFQHGNQKTLGAINEYAINGTVLPQQTKLIVSLKVAKFLFPLIANKEYPKTPLLVPGVSALYVSKFYWIKL